MQSLFSSKPTSLPFIRALLSGITSVAAAFATMLVTATCTIAAPIVGDFDVSFPAAPGKITRFAIGAFDDFVNAMVIQPDGKMVLAGSCYDGFFNRFCVARLTAAGSPDTSFAGSSGATSGGFLLGIGSTADVANAIALQADGKIILAGYCNNGANDDFCVVRLNVNGSFDSSFVGPNGFNSGAFLLPIGSFGDHANAVAVQPDGKIVLAGNCHNGSSLDFCFARLNTNGTLDATFNGPGGNGNGKFLLPMGRPAVDAAASLALQPDGKIVVAGSCNKTVSDMDFCIARLNVDGSLDASFTGPGGAGNGKFLLPIGAANDTLRSVLLQANGNIVLTGMCANGGRSDFCVARLLAANGALDPSFAGPAGNGNGKFSLQLGAIDDKATGAALQTDGKMVLTGYCVASAAQPVRDFCVVRLNSDGSFDTTFVGPTGSGNGKFLLPIGAGDDLASAVAIQPDGKIVLAGSCSTAANFHFCVARLNGVTSANCSMDVDGDGQLLATTDALLITRAMLGMSGNAVIAGAVGAGATRSTWAQIRAYLTSQCGMTLAP